MVGCVRAGRYAGYEGELYIPCGAPTTALKQWPQEALIDGRSLLRIEGRRYERQAVRVTNPDLFAALSRIVAEKYGLSSSETDPEPDDVWFFRMDPRT